MSDKFLIISADGHAGGAPEDYRAYLEPAYRPYVDELLVENEEFLSRGISQHRYSDEQLRRMDEREAIRAGGIEGSWNVERRLKEMDAEGVTAELLNPGHQYATLPFFSAVNKPKAADVRAAGARAYNRWLADHMAGAGGRLVGTADLGPYVEMAATVRELKWAADHGFAAVQPPGSTGDASMPRLGDSYFDPFWAACVETGVALYAHIGYGHPQRDQTAMMMTSPAESFSLQDIDASEEDRVVVRRERNPLGLRMAGYHVRRLMWRMMMSGVLDRHPGLTVVLAEIRSDWVPQTLAYLDAEFARGGLPMKLKPSEYWARNFYVSPSSPRDYEVAMRREVGVDKIMLATDYPHPEGTWPNTQNWLRAVLDGVPESEARLFLGENALACFKRMDAAALRKVAQKIGPSVESLLKPGQPVPQVLIEDFDRRSGYLTEQEVLDTERLAGALTEDIGEMAAA
jgi:predicted TIM-barrel fold metal-dependent hydrolase